MLYPYRLALEKTFPLSPSLVEASPTDRLLRLVCSVSDLFSTQPFPLYKDGAAHPPAALPGCGLFLEGLGGFLRRHHCAVSDHWPLSSTGQPGDRETGQLTIRREGGRGIIRLHSVSGRPFDSMEGLAYSWKQNPLIPQVPLPRCAPNFPPGAAGRPLPEAGTFPHRMFPSSHHRERLLLSGLVGGGEAGSFWACFPPPRRNSFGKRF